MSLIADITLSGELLLFESTFETVPRAEFAFEDVHYLSDENGATAYVFFIWMSGCPVREWEEGLDVDETVNEFRKVTEIDGRQLYRIDTQRFSPDQPLVFPLCRRLDVTIVDSRRTAEGLHLQARFPSRETLNRFVDTVDGSNAKEISVERLYTETREEPNLQFDPTKKQLEALELALADGYFDVPSQTNLTELAELVGISRQAFSRRLNRGLSAVLEREFGRSAGNRT
ncbi:helix-turn-helix domain-containing protein [Halobacteria archaeon AArc-dxtr1]|nr:helix-turn-helix domain-containing protein [Halobacteria archaeon AArc-dxtr1]